MEIPVKSRSPKEMHSKFLLLYGKEKTGKSTVCSMIPNALIIDLKNEYDHLSGRIAECHTFEDLKDLIEKLKAQKEKEQFIVIDNATWLAEMVLPFACNLYSLKQKKLGFSWNGTPQDLMELAYGAGFFQQKVAFLRVFDALKDCCDTIILVGHLKEQAAVGRNPGDMEYSLDLPNALRGTLLREAGSVGVFYRDGNKCILDFNGQGSVTAQARPLHLRGRTIILAESNDEGEITSYWDRIFINN